MADGILYCLKLDLSMHFRVRSSGYIVFDEVKQFCMFTKYTTQEFITKPQSTSMSCYLLHLVHSISNQFVIFNP